MTNGRTGTDMRIVLTKTFSADSASALQDEFDNWRQDREEETFLDWEYQVDGGTHYLFILYTE